MMQTSSPYDTITADELAHLQRLNGTAGPDTQTPGAGPEEYDSTYFDALLGGEAPRTHNNQKRRREAREAAEPEAPPVEATVITKRASEYKIKPIGSMIFPR